MLLTGFLIAKRTENVDGKAYVSHRYLSSEGIPSLLAWRLLRIGLGVGGKWNLDETKIMVKGERMYLCSAIDNNGDTVEFYFSRNRDLQAAKRFLRKALARHGGPERITIDGRQT